jgi:hypothetical protein
VLFSDTKIPAAPYIRRCSCYVKKLLPTQGTVVSITASGRSIDVPLSATPYSLFNAQQSCHFLDFISTLLLSHS